MNNENFKTRLGMVNKHRQKLLTSEERTALQITGYLAIGSMMYTSYRLARFVGKTVFHAKK